MIGWLHPAALLGLAALGGPVLVHLLRRQRAERIVFPSLRFVEATRTAAVRLRLPSDLALLALRLGIVALAAIALAQPILVTGARQRAWAARTSRVIVLDTSPSMRAEAAGARAAARAEADASDDAAVIETEDPAAGIEEAVSRLQAMAPGRREIVVISDFQQGALGPAAIARVPGHAGLRFVPWGQPRPVATVVGARLLGAADIPAREPALTLGETATAVTIRPIPAPDANGLRLLAPAAEGQQIQRLLMVLARAGTPAPRPEEPLAVVFPGGDGPPVRAISGGWMLRAVVAARADATLAAAAAAGAGTGQPIEDPWVVVARDGAGSPLVSAAAAGQELVYRVDAPPAAFVSAALVRAALGASHRDARAREQDTARIPASQLAAWAREPGPPPPDQWRQAQPGDARYAWAAALALLMAESVVRRRRRAVVEEPARAA
jgi:hypothetical protein